jgi:hypothetical protein
MYICKYTTTLKSKIYESFSIWDMVDTDTTFVTVSFYWLLTAHMDVTLMTKIEDQNT